VANEEPDGILARKRRKEREKLNLSQKGKRGGLRVMERKEEREQGHIGSRDDA